MNNEQPIDSIIEDIEELRHAMNTRLDEIIAACNRVKTGSSVDPSPDLLSLDPQIEGNEIVRTNLPRDQNGFVDPSLFWTDELLGGAYNCMKKFIAGGFPSGFGGRDHYKNKCDREYLKARKNAINKTNTQVEVRWTPQTYLIYDVLKNEWRSRGTGKQ